MSSFERLGDLLGDRERHGEGVAIETLPPPPAALRGLRHDEDRLHLLVRDPRRVFALWEVSDALARRAAALASAAKSPIRYALTVECSDRPGGPLRDTFRIALPDAVGGEGWYVDLPRGGGSCRAVLGLDLPRGFEPLLASRWMPVPPEGPCQEIGEWPVDDVHREWLEREMARLRGRAVAPLPSSASRYLASPAVPKP